MLSLMRVCVLLAGACRCCFTVLAVPCWMSEAERMHASSAVWVGDCKGVAWCYGFVWGGGLVLGLQHTPAVLPCEAFASAGSAVRSGANHRGLHVAGAQGTATAVSRCKDSLQGSAAGAVSHSS